jgi:hypothetical protein
MTRFIIIQYNKHNYYNFIYNKIDVGEKYDMPKLHN